MADKLIDKSLFVLSERAIAFAARLDKHFASHLHGAVWCIRGGYSSHQEQIGLAQSVSLCIPTDAVVKSLSFVEELLYTARRSDDEMAIREAEPFQLSQANLDECVQPLVPLDAHAFHHFVMRFMQIRRKDGAFGRKRNTELRAKPQVVVPLDECLGKRAIRASTELFKQVLGDLHFRHKRRPRLKVSPAMRLAQFS